MSSFCQDQFEADDSRYASIPHRVCCYVRESEYRHDGLAGNVHPRKSVTEWP